jgi:AcrR family transcriptional regulator
MGMLARGGLPAFSMRALARELDVQPSALYWHFADKQTLLAAIADEIIEAAEPSGSEATPSEIATGLREVLLAHQDGAEIVMSSIALGLGAAAAHERFVVAFEDAGLERGVAAAAATTSLHYVLGEVMHEQQRAQAVASGVPVHAHPVDAGVTAFERGYSALLRGLGE